jgi:hypothetical protein
MSEPETTARRRWFDWYASASLFLLVAGVYWGAAHYGFVAYDDYDYVSHNQHVLSGLNAGSVRWALTSTDAGNWFPLTWISLMADRQLFPAADEIPPDVISAAAHHRTNIVLHAAATVLLFLLLKRTTGRWGPSVLVALWFGLHPLRVESVAWVAERKDVLSGVLWMLALHAYTRYASRPGATAYLATVFLYCAGFMAKPMAITLPLVLLLFDVWPLRRIPPNRKASRVVLWEKLPFYALALVMAVIAYTVQKRGGAVRTLQEVPVGTRLQNAIVSAVIYIGKTLWPTRLAVLYPFRQFPAWQVIAAGVLLAGATWLAVRSLRLRPYIFTGWCWYAITVLPVIGIVQVGVQARADRYTYLPTIGLYLMLAWGGAEIWEHRPRWRPVLAVACAGTCLACVTLTVRQIPYWRDSAALFQHAIDVTGPNALAHGYLGDVWRAQLMYDQAAAEYRRGLAIAPRNANLLVDFGDALIQAGRAGEAISPLNEAAALQPGDPVIRQVLARALFEQGRWNEAIDQLQEAIRIDPGSAEAHALLGAAFERASRPRDAIAEYSEALRLHPGWAAAQQGLERALNGAAKANSSDREHH